MPRCIRCGASSPFLKLNKNLLCLKCVTAELKNAKKEINFLRSNKDIFLSKTEEKSTPLIRNSEIKPQTEDGNVERSFLLQDIFYSELNPPQINAVISTEGRYRIIAGAGSGKTKALICRYAYLVERMGISPENVLCVTFTNKAAKEMVQRLRKRLGDIGDAFVCTFHALCVRIIREEYRVIHYPKKFTVIDESDQKMLIKEAIDELGIQSSELTVRYAQRIIELEKSKRYYIPYLSSETTDLLKKAEFEASNSVMRVFWRYQLLQRKNFGLDFGDLINIGLYILENDASAREKWQRKFQYIMVDEFQDVNVRQYELCKVLQQYHKNLFVVGDPDQMIYSFRGADVRFILDFDKTFPDTKTILFEENYRSTPQILSAANSLIEKNKYRIEKNLFTKNRSGTPVFFSHHADRKDEAKNVLQEIRDLHAEGTSYSDMAILYRNHSVSLFFEEALNKNGIPYQIYSGIPFFAREEVKVAISYMKMVTSDDETAFLRTINFPKRGIGKTRIALLKTYMEEHGGSLLDALIANSEGPKFVNTKAADYIQLINKYRSLSKQIGVTEILEGLLNDSGYEPYLRFSGEDDRLDNLAELKQSVYMYESEAQEDVSISDYLSHVSLLVNEPPIEKKNAVQMMSIHSAKGLEFDHVFLVGFNEGVLPSGRCATKPEIEEERRVTYVAYTRSKKELFLSESSGIKTNNQYESGIPSRFLFESNMRDMMILHPLPEEIVQKANEYMKNDFSCGLENGKYGDMCILEVGDSIYHPVFGEGEITSRSEDSFSYIVKFSKTSTERSISFFAPIAKIKK